MKPTNLSTPDRRRLITHFDSVNRLAKIVLGVEAAVVIFAMALLLDWNFHLRNWIYSLTAVAFAIGSEWSGLIFFVLQRKTAINDLREDARFGAHTKQSLKELIQSIFHRLRLPPGKVEVLLARSKDVNAFAMPMGLLPLSRSANLIQLNRSILHVLNPGELTSVVGHELGHLIRYDFAWFRYLFVHGVAAACIALLILQSLPLDDWTVFFAIALVLGAFYWMVHWPLGVMSRSIEFLCDDFGACVSGVVPAINSELKIGSANEVQLKMLLHAIRMRRAGANLNAKDVLELHEKALPFGEAQPEVIVKDLERLVREREREKSGVSLGGFWDYLNSDREDNQDEAFDELLREMSQIEKHPKIDWTSEFLSPGAQALTESQISALVERIEQFPDHVLFHVPGEEKDDDSTHPGTRRRILYLWRNRDAITRDAV